MQFKALTTEEMRAAEQFGVELGISKLCMMENAGASIARFLLDLVVSDPILRTSKVRIVLLAGTGNNGGDVFVTARHLAFWNRNFQVSLFLVGEVENIRAEEAASNWNITKKCKSVRTSILSSEERISDLTKELLSADVIVVGIFGTGFKGMPRLLQRRVIESINAIEKAVIVSIDVPSGLDADTGSYDVAVVSDYTVTMHAPKVGMLSESGRKICGGILVANIGIPR